MGEEGEGKGDEGRGGVREEERGGVRGGGKGRGKGEDGDR